MGIGRNIFQKILFILLISLLITSAYLQPAFSKEITAKHILIVNSYHKGFSWTDDQVDASKKVLYGAFEGVELFVEYLDTKRIYNPEYLGHISDIFSIKYTKTDIDGIITTDDNALKFVLNNRAYFKKGTPVIFCGINNIDDIPLEGEKDVSGFVETLDVKDTLDLALRLHPGIKNIVVVVDDTPTGKGQKSEIAKVSSKYPGLKFEYITGDKYSTEEMLEKLSLLSNDTLVLLAVWLRDKNNEYISEEKSGKRISSAASVPVYGLVDMYLTKGIIGGKLLTSRDHGRAAAELLVKTLKGDSGFLDKARQEKNINHYVFDHVQLERWNIKVSQLPAGSIIVNKPFSIYEEYNEEIWFGIVLVIIQALMIAFLLFNLAKRKSAEKALIESEEHFRFLAENAKDAIYRMSLKDGHYEYMSSASIDIFGYSPQEFYDQPLLIRKLIHPDFLYYFEKEWKDLVAGNMPLTYEYKIVHRSGEEKWLYQRNSLVLDDKGKPLAIEGIVTDLTERKIYEEELRKEKEVAQRYLDTVGSIIVALDKDGNITLINNRGLSILGYEYEEIIGKNWFERCIPYKNHDKVISVFKQLMEGSIARFEYNENNVLTKKGEERLIAWHNNVIQDTDGSIKGILSSGQDITERRMAEKALTESESKFRSLLENLPQQIFAKDLDSVYTSCNTNYAKSLSIDPKDIVGKTDFDFYPKSYAEKYRADDKAVITSGEAIFVEESYIKDGEECIAQTAKIPIKDEDGKIIGVQGVFLDITERKKSQEAINKEREIAQKYLDIVGVLVMVLDIDGNIIMVNKRGAEILGSGDEDIIGINWFERFIPEKFKEQVFGVFKELMSGNLEAAEYYENPVLSSSGEERLIAWHNTILRDERGLMNGILCSGEDITERSRAEKVLLSQKYYLESMDQINNCIQNSDNVEDLLNSVLEKCISIFECDRAWLLFPCDIEVEYWSVLKEMTREGYPGAFSEGNSIPSDDESREAFKCALDSNFPISYDLKSGRSLPQKTAKRFNIKSQIVYAIYPKKGKPWLFGLHQCSSERVWSAQDSRLVMEIGRRIEDGLSSLMFLKELTESEESLSLAQKMAGIGSWKHYVGSNKLVWSDELYKIYGLDPEGVNLSLDYVMGMIHEDDRDNIYDLFGKAVNNGLPYEADHRIVKPNGEERFLHVLVNVEKDINGKTFAIFGTGQDVTQRNKAEAELKEREKQLSLLVENMGDVISQHLPDSTITYVSASCKNLLGYKAIDLLGKRASDLVHPEDLYETMKIIDSAVDRKDEMYRLQHRLKLINGNYIWVETLGKLIYNPEGSLLEIQCSVRDIMERKRAELELEKSEALMKKSVEGMLEGYALHEAIFNEQGRMVDYRFIEFNPSAEKIANLRREDIVGKTALEVYPNVVDRGLLDKYADVMATGKAAYIEDFYYQGDSLDRGFDISCFPVDEKHFVCVFRDITERMRDKEELVKAKEKAEQINEAKSEFLMNISHDIRTPMNVINGFNDLLMRTPLNAEQQKFCMMVKNKGKDLLRLMEDIIDISSVEKGKIRIHQSPFSMIKLVDDISQTVSLMIADKDIKFECNISDDIPERLLGDSMRLKQVLENLCVNAVKYTKKGRINLNVSIEDVNPEDNFNVVRFEVEDTGIGISLNNLSKIFDPFTRFYDIEDANYKHGVGMGLHIVRTLVKEMGGQIFVESEEGRGSKFYFSLKIQEPGVHSSEKEREASELSEALDGEVKLTGLNILVAEDDDATRMLMERSFRDAECNIKFVSDGEEVIEELKKNRYDLVLMDLRMPRMDGIEATRVIRKDIDKGIPILALTAHAMDFVEDQCMGVGMNGYLSKPVDIDKLKRAIQEYIKENPEFN